MKHILALFIVLLCLPTLFSCDTTKQQPLLEDLSLPQEDHPQWSELFSSNYTATPLETDSTCMIGVIDKIKKFNNEYYIASSGSSIHRFNNKGKHVMSLNKKGQGPEEYIHVEDFDIYSINGQTEIWISDYENLKIYDANNGSFLRKISFPFTIYKFKRMENGHLLLVTGQNDHFLTLTDEQGNILSEYLEKKVPFLLFRAVQFVKYKNEYLFQLGMSNSYVSFNPETETFSRGVYTPQNDYLTDQQLIELYSTFGIDFIREANNGTHLSNIIPLGNTLWLQIRHADKNYLSKLDNGKMTSTEFTYGSFLSTISVGDSENSLLLYLQPDQLQEIPQKLTDKQGQEIQRQIDDNPVIVEFFNNYV